MGAAYAEVDLNDPADYYLGYKAGVVLQWDEVSRGLSDRTGTLQHLSFGATFSDTDRRFRTLLDGAAPNPTNRSLVLRQIDDEDRRVGGTPRIAANGYVINYTTPPFKFKLEGGDWLLKRYTYNQKSQLGWQPLILTTDFDIDTTPPQVLERPAPFPYGVFDDSDEQTVADSDHSTGYIADITSVTATVHGAVPNPTDRTYYFTGLNDKFGDPRQHPLNDHRGETTGFMVTVVGAPSDEDFRNQIAAGTVTYWVEFTWTCADATYGRVYGRQDGQIGCIGYAEMLGGGSFSFADGQNTDTSTPIFVAPVTSVPPPRNNTYMLLGGGNVTTDTGSGLVKGVYTGLRRLIDTVYYSEFLFAACALKGNFKIYIDGVRVTVADLAANYQLPGNVNINASNPWFEIYGRRYTTVYVSRQSAKDLGLVSVDELAPGAAILTANFDGIEDVGDGSGAVITSLALQMQHFAENALAPDRPINAQDWEPGPPYFGDIDPPLSVVDRDSFSTVDADCGLTGRWVIGYNQQEMGAEAVLAGFCLSGDFEVSFNRKGQMQLTREPASIPGSLTNYTDIINIVDGSLAISDQVREFFNILPYKWGPDFSGRISGGPITIPGGVHLNLPSSQGWNSIAAGEKQITSPTSIIAMGQSVPTQSMDLPAIPDTTQAALVLARCLQRRSYPLRVVRLKLPLSGTNIDLGDTFTVTAADGIGASGWSGRALRCYHHILDPNTNTVTIDAYDLYRALYGPP